MKVNISGRGVIPGIGTLAPVYNKEVSESGIKRILNFQQFKVYSAKSGLLITKANISKILTSDGTVSTPAVKKTAKSTSKKKVAETPKTVAAPVEEVNPVETPVVEPVVEETVVPVEIEAVDDIVVTDDAVIDTDKNIEITVDADITSDETVEESVTEETVDEPVETLDVVDAIEEIPADEETPKTNQYSGKKKKNKKH